MTVYDNFKHVYLKTSSAVYTTCPKLITIILNPRHINQHSRFVRRIQIQETQHRLENKQLLT